MKEKIIKILSRDRKTVGSAKLTVFLFLLLISFTFWLLNYLSYSYKSSLSVAVYYADLPKDKLLLATSDSELNIRLKGKGFDLFKKKYFSFAPRLMLRVNDYLRYDSVEGNAYILSNQLNSDLQKELDGEVEVLDIHPDTLFLTFSANASKKVPVVSNVLLQLREQYRFIQPLSFTPDSVVISGPMEVVDTISFVRTKQAYFSDVAKGMNRFIGLENDLFNDPHIAENIHIDYDRVRMGFEVQKYTESFFEKRIVVVNAFSDVQLLPEKVKVFYKVNLDDFDQINPDMIDVGFDLARVNVEDGNKALVNVLSAPAAIEITAVDPPEVSFIIKKKLD